MHALNKNFTQALSHYHHALAIDPTLKTAVDGLERIEAMIRAVEIGHDPNCVDREALGEADDHDHPHRDDVDDPFGAGLGDETEEYQY
jgi:hypothetical protein